MFRRVLRSLSVSLAVVTTISGFAAQPTAIDVPKAPTPAPAQNVAMPATACNPSTGMAGPYPCKKIDLLYFMPLADLDCGSAAVVWGWTDPSNNKEYALLACNTGVSFVDISTPTAPVYVGRLPGHSANSLWRDVKVYDHYAFVGSEASGHGLQVFDLYRLRNHAGPPTVFTEDAWYGNFTRSHTIWINNNAGSGRPPMLTAAGSQEGPQTCSGDLHFVDITNPLAPTFAGCLGKNGYVHEAQCVNYIGPDTQYQGHEICFTSNGRFDNTDTFGIDDVTDKNNVQQLAKVSYPNPGYTHQTYTTEDQQYLLMDDEFDEQDFGFNSRTLVWDIRDLNNPVYVGPFYGATTAVDHNQYIRGHYAFQSNYRAGLRIIDIANIASFPNQTFSEYAYFDIYPSDDVPDYNASWCNYPFFASGNVAVSGIEQGLFILRPQFLPKISINDVSVTEGTGGFRNITFTISLSAPSTQQVVVHYATAPGTAIGGAVVNRVLTPPDADYLTTSGVVVIPAGTTTRTQTVGIVSDATTEDNETFYVNLSAPTGAELEKAQGVATIVDDDLPVPTISMNDVSVNEGDNGTTDAAITLSVTPATSQNVTVHWSTADGTAVGGEDYVVSSGTTDPFVDGHTTIHIPINGDLTIEPNETVLINFDSPSGAILGRSQATLTITNDDLLSVATITPRSGPATGGSPVTITGTRFSDGVTIHFGETPATDITVLDQATLTATTPAGTPASLVVIDAHLGTVAPFHPPLHHPAALTFFYDFLDVPANHMFHNFVEKLFRAGITTGCGSGNYCPDTPVTRAQMAVFLLASRYGSSYSPPPPTGRFGDVPIDSPFAPYIEELYSLGVTGGCSSSPLMYCPDSPVTREQMAVLLLRTKEGNTYTPPDATGVFGDVPTSSPFARWIEELARRGVTGGCGGGMFCPQSAVTRGQMAVFLSTTFGLQ